MRNTFRSVIAALSLMAGCSLSSSSVESRNTGHPTEECGCKIEGTGIGTEGIFARFDGTIVSLEDWVPKAGSPGEYVGFTMYVDGAPSVGYVVKAGGERYASHTRTWVHPAGASAGADAPAISHVDMCPDCPGGDCGPDTTCQDPDGCPDPTTGQGPFF